MPIAIQDLLSRSATRCTLSCSYEFLLIFPVVRIRIHTRLRGFLDHVLTTRCIVVYTYAYLLVTFRPWNLEVGIIFLQVSWSGSDTCCVV